MKRKEQILQTSLELFNTVGEANLSAVDIAFEMDISPGNLYYHYRGKEEIVAALFERFENTLKILLQEALEIEVNQRSNNDSYHANNNESNNESNKESFVVFYYYLLDQIYQYRFFYRNLNDMVEKYPGISKRFKKLMQCKHQFCEANLLLLLDTKMLDYEKVNPVGLTSIAENMVMMLTYYYEYYSITQSLPDRISFIKACFKKIISLIAPFSCNNFDFSINYAEQIAAQFDYFAQD